MGPKRLPISVFQAEWPVQVHTTNFVVMLAQAGYDVELFLFNPWNPNYVDVDKLEHAGRLNVYDLTGLPRVPSPPCRASDRLPSFIQRLKRFCQDKMPTLTYVYRSTRLAISSAIQNAGHACLLLVRSDDGLLPHGIVAQAQELMSKKSYHCVIGVEKKGLIWAGKIAGNLGVPLVYYSLELMTDDYARLEMPWSFEFRRLRAAERTYHRTAAATIIQDTERARVLFQDNGVPMEGARIFYLPVSVMGRPYTNRSRFFQEAFGLSRDTKVILSFGLLNSARYVFELAEVAQMFPEDWVLVLHGPAYPESIVERIKAIDRRGKVILSLQRVPVSRVREVIASADIGLALYPSTPANDRLTAFASEKTALYLQCGVPLIAFDHPGYRRLANEEQCGVIIQRSQELPKAIEIILASREQFARNAFRTFEKYYDFARNFTNLLPGIETLRFR